MLNIHTSGIRIGRTALSLEKASILLPKLWLGLSDPNSDQCILRNLSSRRIVDSLLLRGLLARNLHRGLLASVMALMDRCV